MTAFVVWILSEAAQYGSLMLSSGGDDVSFNWMERAYTVLMLVGYAKPLTLALLMWWLLQLSTQRAASSA
jgi:hypothetical protein